MAKVNVELSEDQAARLLTRALIADEHDLVDALKTALQVQRVADVLRGDNDVDKIVFDDYHTNAHIAEIHPSQVVLNHDANKAATMQVAAVVSTDVWRKLINIVKSHRTVMMHRRGDSFAAEIEQMTGQALNGRADDDIRAVMQFHIFW